MNECAHAVRRSGQGKPTAGGKLVDTPRALPEPPKTEDVQVFLVLTMPIFAVTLVIIVVILLLSPR